MNAEQHEWYWRGYNDAKKEKQREFLGLTDEEVNNAIKEKNITPLFTYRMISRAIEAKLKQKNGFTEEKNT